MPTREQRRSARAHCASTLKFNSRSPRPPGRRSAGSRRATDPRRSSRPPPQPRLSQKNTRCWAAPRSHHHLRPRLDQDHDPCRRLTANLVTQTPVSRLSAQRRPLPAPSDRRARARVVGRTANDIADLADITRDQQPHAVTSQVPIELLEHLDRAESINGMSRRPARPRGRLLAGGREYAGTDPIRVGEVQPGLDPEHRHPVRRDILGVPVDASVVADRPRHLPARGRGGARPGRPKGRWMTRSR
jgi:hypothetical protein